MHHPPRKSANATNRRIHHSRWHKIYYSKLKPTTWRIKRTPTFRLTNSEIKSMPSNPQRPRTLILNQTSMWCQLHCNLQCKLNGTNKKRKYKNRVQRKAHSRRPSSIQRTMDDPSSKSQAPSHNNNADPYLDAANAATATELCQHCLPSKE